MSALQRRSQSNHRQLWAFLSLLALMALAAPQYLWACSMTGKVSATPDRACPCAAAPGSDELSGEANIQQAQHETAHACCNQLPLPSGDTSGHDGKGQLSNARAIPLAYEPVATSSTLAVVPTLAPSEVLAPVVALDPPSIPPLISQQSSAVHSGRAPPL